MDSWESGYYNSHTHGQRPWCHVGHMRSWRPHRRIGHQIPSQLSRTSHYLKEKRYNGDCDQSWSKIMMWQWVLTWHCARAQILHNWVYCPNTRWWESNGWEIGTFNLFSWIPYILQMLWLQHSWIRTSQLPLQSCRTGKHTPGCYACLSFIFYWTMNLHRYHKTSHLYPVK